MCTDNCLFSDMGTGSRLVSDFRASVRFLALIVQASVPSNRGIVDVLHIFSMTLGLKGPLFHMITFFSL